MFHVEHAAIDGRPLTGSPVEGFHVEHPGCSDATVSRPSRSAAETHLRRLRTRRDDRSKQMWTSEATRRGRDRVEA